MSPLAPLLAAFFLAPVPSPVTPPAFAIFAKADEVILILATNRNTPMRIADPVNVGGLSYSRFYIRVEGPDGALVWQGEEGGWWTPYYATQPFLDDLPEPWSIHPGQIVTFRTQPDRLAEGLPIPRKGVCRYQARAIIEDFDAWPKSAKPNVDAWTLDSDWVAIPCASLRKAR